MVETQIIKISLPKELIFIKNNEHYFDVSDTQKFKTYVYYINQKIDHLVNKYKLTPDKHFLHTGNRLSFSKNMIREQTWLEPIDGIPCYASWYSIRPLLPNVIAPGFFNYKDNIINLESIPNIISYINIVELTNNKLVEQSTDFTSFFDRNVNSKKLVKRKVLTRKNYLNKIGNCGYDTFEFNSTDAVIMSKEAIIKSKPETKILIIIDNPYSISNKMVDNKLIYREFNLLSNMFDTSIFNSFYIIKYFTQKYNKYLHHLTIYKYPSNANKNNLLAFCKSLLQNMIDKVVNNPYILDFTDKTKYKNTTVYRPNHGSINILRQGLFSIKILQLFKKRNTKLFNQIFHSKERLICLILASFFKSIARIGEGLFEGNYDNYVDDITLKKMFPGLPIPFYKDVTITGYSIFSSILYKSIFDNIGIDTSQYQDISYLLMYYLHLTDDGNNKLFNINNFNFNNSQNKYIEPIIIRELISVGHELDHCRGSYSGILYEPIVRLLNNTILLTLEDKKDIMNFVKSTLIKTQFKNKVKKNEVCTIEDETLLTKTNNPSKKCCDRLNKHLSRNKRYTNKQFYKLSNNFSLLYKTLDIENQIKQLL